jgi:(R,R)-butanediol dehydrogenase/meso-butanediol dehydrogenase/diacetyl reductase
VVNNKEKSSKKSVNLSKNSKGATMKTAILQEDNTFKIQECPTPAPGNDEVLIKIAYCGICGSDIHMLNAHMFPPGCIIGHEISGYVAKAGKNVSEWREGDPVVVFPMEPCGNCAPCSKGEVQHCKEGIGRRYGVGLNPGGFAQYILTKPSMLFKVPKSLDMKLAALTEPLATSVRGVNNSNIKKGSHSLIMGAGPIGLFCIPALKNKGAGRIFITEPDSFRAEKAAALGADYVFNPKKDDPADEIKKITGEAPEYIFDCAGTEDSIQDAAYIAGNQGRILILGLYHGNVSILPIICLNKELSLNFSLGYNWKDFSDSIELLSKGKINPDIFISKVVKLDEINDAFTALNKPGNTKILIDCS